MSCVISRQQQLINNVWSVGEQEVWRGDGCQSVGRQCSRQAVVPLSRPCLCQRLSFVLLHIFHQFFFLTHKNTSATEGFTSRVFLYTEHSVISGLLFVFLLRIQIVLSKPPQKCSRTSGASV